jgi:hypothetical protein
MDICEPHRKHFFSCQECIFIGSLPNNGSTCHRISAKCRLKPLLVTVTALFLYFLYQRDERMKPGNVPMQWCSFFPRSKISHLFCYFSFSPTLLLFFNSFSSSRFRELKKSFQVTDMSGMGAIYVLACGRMFKFTLAKRCKFRSFRKEKP